MLRVKKILKGAKLRKFVSLTIAGFMAFWLTGCATTQLQTQAKMTRSVFLDPVKKEQKTIFVAVRNTSGQEVNLEDKLIAELQKKGYRIVDDPEMAKFVLMVNVLFANNLKEVNAPGGATAGSSIGAAVGSSGGSRDAIVGAVAGAVIGGVLAKATEDDIFRMVVDVVVRQKIDQKVAVSEESSIGQANTANQRRAGFMNTFAGPIRSKDGAGKLYDNIHEQKNQQYATNYIEKKTRIFAEAVKLNLQLVEAIPILENKISKSIAGIF
jgi:outer membrane lipoprotein SlyB